MPLRMGAIGAGVLALLLMATALPAIAATPSDTRWELAVAERVPEFASAFLDGQGMLQLRVTDTSDAVVDELRDILAGMFGDLTAPDRVEVHEVPYSFLTLYAWRDLIADEFSSIPGVTLSGIDHDPPALLLGTVDDDAQAQVRAMLARNGVPDDAVNLIIISYPITDELLVIRPPYAAPPVIGHVQPDPPAGQGQWQYLVATAVVVLGLIALATGAVRRRVTDRPRSAESIARTSAR